VADLTPREQRKTQIILTVCSQLAGILFSSGDLYKEGKDDEMMSLSFTMSMRFDMKGTFYFLSLLSLMRPL
jgi:hypothetical protein